MTTLNKYHLAGEIYFIAFGSRIAGNGFCDDACFNFYLRHLLNSLNVFQLKLHAYLLLPNEVCLLVTPGTPYCVIRLMRSLNRAYSEYFNARFERTVKVWCDIPRCSLIRETKMALECQKYIERRPLASLELDHPGRYRWSSYCANAFGGDSYFLTPLEAYRAMLCENPNPYRSYRDHIATPFAKEFQRHLTTKFEPSAPITDYGRHMKNGID
jgi:putative transposase